MAFAYGFVHGVADGRRWWSGHVSSAHCPDHGPGSEAGHDNGAHESRGPSRPFSVIGHAHNLGNGRRWPTVRWVVLVSRSPWTATA
jgi:hypothetical protein